MNINGIDYQTFIQIINSIPSCIFFKDKELRYVFSTHYWNQLLSKDIIGKTDLEIRKDTDNAKLATECDQNIMRTGSGCTYVIKTEIDGEVNYLEIIKEPVFNYEGEIIGLVGLINDVTEKTLLQNKINKLITTDSLTNVLNRKTGTDTIMLSLKNSRENKAFCLLDINKFKDINDTYGHQMGDKVLQKFSNALKQSVYPEDIVMRLGGDEFIIFLNNISEIKQIESFINKLFEYIDSISIEGFNDKVTASIGVCMVESNSDFDSLYAESDKNMYEAKNKNVRYII